MMNIFNTLVILTKALDSFSFWTPADGELNGTLGLYLYDNKAFSKYLHLKLFVYCYIILIYMVLPPYYQ